MQKSGRATQKSWFATTVSDPEIGMKFIAAIYAMPTGQEEVIPRTAVMPSLPVLIVAKVGFVMVRSAAILKKIKKTPI